MGGNGDLLQIHFGIHLKMFQKERKMKKKGGGNGGIMGGKWDMLRQVPHFSRSPFPPFSKG